MFYSSTIFLNVGVNPTTTTILVGVVNMVTTAISVVFLKCKIGYLIGISLWKENTIMVL